MPPDPHSAWAQAVRTLSAEAHVFVDQADPWLRSTLASLDRAGFVLAPKEATDDMTWDARDPLHHAATQGETRAAYRAMLAARPAMPPEERKDA